MSPALHQAELEKHARLCCWIVLSGYVAFSLLALFCVPWQWSLMSASSQTRWIALGMLAAGAFSCLGGAVFFLAGHPTHRWFEKRLRLRPAHSLRDEAARIWGVLCDNKMLVAKVIGAALITQLIHCGIFYLAGVSVGIESSAPDLVYVCPNSPRGKRTSHYHRRDWDS